MIIGAGMTSARRPPGWLVDGSLVVMTLIWGATFRILADLL